MPANYPRDTDLQQFFDTCGIIDTARSQFGALNTEAKISAAIAWWEKTTGWRPFLAAPGAAQTTRTFDIPHASRVLDLRAGLLSVSSLTIFDTPYEQDEDFFLQPANAQAEGEPFTHIRFLGRLHSRLPNAIRITGVWGYCQVLPGDVWEAVLQHAAHLCVPQIALYISKGIYEIREGDELRRFAGSSQSPLSSERAMWLDYAKETARSKKRISA